MEDEKDIEEDTAEDTAEDMAEVTAEVTDPEATVTSEPSNAEGTASVELSQTSKTDSIIEADATKADGASLTETKQNGEPSNPSVQSSAEAEDVADEQSLNQNGSKTSELSWKKSSLDQLATDRSSEIQKSRANRMHRQCQRSIRELIGKREVKNEELGKMQGDLRQRLNILECSMPAVMVWNIWRMSQGGSVPSLRRVLEKQFQGPASGEIYCPSTPSRHFDCRVREVEAERKQAQKRVEEARTLWAEKMTVLEEREKNLEEAKKIREETKARIQQLTAEVQKLKEAAANMTEDDGSCETGECGVIECKKKWLGKISSNASIKSTDLECLEKLQELAETELCMKKQIADLERREEAYMRTLQQADELWLKIEGDTASTMSALQEQLDTKTAANQQMANRICQLEDQLELLRSRMVKCRGELEKFMSIEKIEALIGRDDDFAEVFDQISGDDIKMRHKGSGAEDDLAGVMDKDMLAKPDLEDVGIKVEPYTDEKGILTKAEMLEKDMLAKPGVGDASLGIRPEDLAAEQEKLDQARDYLARLGSLSALDGDDDRICSPGFECNDQVFTDTGLSEEEMTALKEKRVTAKMLLDAMLAGHPEMQPTQQAKEPTAARKIVPTEVQETTIAFKQELPIDEEEETADAIAESDEMKEPIVKTEFVEKEIAAPDDERPSSPVVRSMEVTTSTIEGTPDTDDILVPRNGMLKWRDDTDIIREAISKCPDCFVVKKNADDVAEEIARYLGTELKEIQDDYIIYAEDVAVGTEIASEKESEIEMKFELEERPEPEIEEVQVTMVEAIKEVKEVEEPVEAEVVTDLPPTVDLREAEEVADVVTKEYPPEPPTAPLVEDKPDTEVVPEVTHEPDEIKIPVEDIPTKYDEVDVPPVDVKEERKPVIVDEERKIAEEIPLPDKIDTGPEQVIKVEVETLPVQREEPEVIEAVLPASDEEVKVKVEVLPAVEEKVRTTEEVVPVKEEEIPEEREVEVKVEVKELPTVKEEVDVDVEVLPVVEEVAPEEIEVEVDMLAEEEIKDEVDMIPEEEIKVEVDVLAEEEIKEEVDIIPEEEIKDEVDMIPEEEEKITMEELGPEEIDIKVDVVAEVEEPTVVEAPPKEEIDVKVDVVREEEEIPVPEEEIEVDVALLPITEEIVVEEEREVEVHVEVLPEEVEELVPPDVIPLKEEIESVSKEIPSELVEEPEMPRKEVPVKREDFFLVSSEEDVDSCKCMTNVPPSDNVSSEETVPSEKDASCTCMTPDSSILGFFKKPSKKMEDTQTDSTPMQIAQIKTAEVVTQTMTEVAIQTQPAQKIRRAPQPKYITISSTAEQEVEMLGRLARWKKVSKERSTITTTTIGSQTEKFSYSQALHTSRTEVTSKIGVEHELRSIHYGTKVEQPVVCNCCLCGKTVSSCCLSKAGIEGQPPSILRLLAALPMLSKLRSPPVDQEAQQETFCPECKMRRFQEALKIPDSPEKLDQVIRKPMRDQEINTECTPSPYKRPSSARVKQKTDQCCMVKISRLRMERTLKKNATVDTCETLCPVNTTDTVSTISTVDTISTTDTVDTGTGECRCLQQECMHQACPENEHLLQCPEKSLGQGTKASPKEDNKDSMDCICNATTEPGAPGVVKNVRCACGDPD